jgi:Fe-S oxidoreductase
MSIGNRKKICLINPPTTDLADAQMYFPMALITLGGVIKSLGGHSELWDFDLYFRKIKNSSEKSFRKLIQHGVDGIGTDVFGISSICSNFPMALWIAKEIKFHRPNSMIILGGPQPSSLPTEILKTFDFIDVVAIGEGEKTLEELFLAGFKPEKFAQIPGLAIRENGEIKLTPKRTLIKDMDEFPFPDYSLINFEDYISHQSGAYYPNVEVGRGCPFHCTFCSTALMWEKDYRVKSPQRILAEMEHLYNNHGFQYFDFIHDNFTTSRKFVLDFCDFMDKNNRHQLKWKASSRTDCIDVKRLEIMQRAGLFGLFFGIETGSERMQSVIKKNLDFDHFEPILRRGNQLGMGLTTAFILGFPEEKFEDLNETIIRALHYKSVGTQNVYFSKLTALTGTSIYRDNLNKFSELSQVSNTSPQDYGLPYIYALIRNHPNLFSSFYHVDHPEFTADFLTRLTEFAQLLVSYQPDNALMLQKSLGLNPINLFILWDRWASKYQIPYYNFRIYSPQSFKINFIFFINELILSQNNQASESQRVAV